MFKFRMSRRGFIHKSAGAATLGLAACGGGATVGSNGAAPFSVSGTSGSAPATGTSPQPGSTSSPAPNGTNATAKPAASAAFPSGSVSSGTRGPNSLPDSTKPAGTANAALPFEHIVVVMQENHSFDNYFGMLPMRGQPQADGFTFDSNGNPLNRNPLNGGYQHVFHLVGTCNPYSPSQAWNETHEDVNDGAMDGFANTCDAAMGYWDESDIPFYYSLAKTFCVGNRSFCSTQGQTYPNRRYMMAGTSSGVISTSSASLSPTFPAPANGTLMDVMSKYGVTWKDYFVDLPHIAIIPQNVENHPTNFGSIAEFIADCAAGTLPNVSYVDPEFGATSEVGSPIFNALQSIPNLPASITSAMNSTGNSFEAQGSDEEGPCDIANGEIHVANIVNAVMSSPLWPKILLIWTYDEHGGFYDHVPPLGAPLPDGIAPMISSTDYQAQFDVTGVRVPTVVVSPYSKPNGVSNVPHDHTSIIATIAAKWNLPALTYRDAQANTLLDYLNLSGPPAFLTPPTLAQPAKPTAEGRAPSFDELGPDAVYAIPGVHTTAFAMLRLALGRTPKTRVIRFDEIVKAVVNGDVDAGLIIHESRFTYQETGLVQVVDLGDWWEHETGHPIPLGAILVRRDISDADAEEINASIRRSLKFAQTDEPKIIDYVREHAFEMSDDVMHAHIGLYVNEYSDDVGESGREAITDFFKRIADAGFVPAGTAPEFV